MSIIHDALKKVQSGLQNNASPVIGQPLTASKTKNKGTIIWVVLVLLILALSAGYTYWQNSHQLKTPPPVIAAVVVTPQAKLPPSPAPMPIVTEVAPVAVETIKIEGILADPKGNVVLINGRIYAEGDEINGARIIKINLDGIVISRDGKEETVRVGQH